MVKISIDSQELEALEDTTILEAAKSIGIKIPTLCYDKNLSLFGACRICIVEVEGHRERFVTACTTPVSPGMKIRTRTDQIIKARKAILELMLVNHPLDCPICDKGGECELQNLVYEYGVSSSRFERFREDVKLRKDYESHLIERDMNRCILCGKCARTCDELINRGEISFVNRGARTIITTDFERPLDCDFCGMCINACPVGALTYKPFKYKARAWELTNKKTICPFCNVGCSITARTKDKTLLKVEGACGINEGAICVRGHFGWDYIYSEKRLKTPLIKKDGFFQSVSWDIALELVSRKFKELKGSLACIVGGSLTQEELYLAKEFVNSCLESNIYCSDESFSSYEGVFSSLGYIPSVSPSSIKDSDCILLLTDCFEINPVLNTFLNYAVKSKEAILISISPYRTRTTKMADYEFIVEPGKERDVLLKMQKVILDNNLVNWDFVNKNTEGFEELRDALSSYPYDIKIQNMAFAFAKAKNPVVIAYGKDIIRSSCNLLLLLGRPNNIIICGRERNSRGAYEIIRENRMNLEDPTIKGLFLIEDVVSLGLLKKKEFVVFCGMFMEDGVMEADVILPTASPLEKDGTLIALFGIPQKGEKVVELPNCKGVFEILQLLSKMQGFSIDGDYKRKDNYFEKGRFFVPHIKEEEGEGFDIVISFSHFHSGYISRYSKNLMEVSPFPILKMNKDDISELKIKNNAKIMIPNPIVVKVVEERDIPKGRAILMEHPAIANLFQKRQFRAIVEG